MPLQVGDRLGEGLQAEPMTNQVNNPTVPNDVQLQMKLEQIFMPFATRQRQLFNERRGRFVHYTSAAAALSIIKNKCLWMRSALVHE